MSDRKHVVVVGAGVTSGLLRDYLAEAGWRVTVLDRGRVRRPACSHANCGYVCPSHVLPLAVPGAVWATLKTLFRRNSPLEGPPRLSCCANLGWFLGFARRCNARDMLEPARASRRC